MSNLAHSAYGRTIDRRVLVCCDALLDLPDKWIGNEGHALGFVHAATREEVLEHLRETQLHMLVLGVEHAEPKLIETAQKMLPDAVIVFLVERRVDPALVKLVPRLGSFVCLSSKQRGTALARELEAILFPRAEMRYRIRGSLTVSFRHGRSGYSGPYPLWDISNRGLSWVMKVGAEPAPLFPENIVTDLIIRKRTEVILLAPRVVIRNLVTLSGSAAGRLPRHYRLGAAFVPFVAPSPTSAKVVREPVEIIALLQRALRAEGMSLHLPHDSHNQYRFREGRLDVDRPEVLTLSGNPPPEMVQGAAVQASFEAAGWSCSFVTSIIGASAPSEGSALTLRSPSIIEARKRRDAARCAFSDPSPVTVGLRSPFLDHTLEYPVLDISTRGLQLRLEGHDSTLPPGTRLRNISIRGLAPEVLTADAIVQFVRRETVAEKVELRCGASLKWRSERDRVLATDAVVRLQRPRVKSGQGMSFDELWSFFKRVGFVYPEKEESLRQVFPEVRDNVSRLLQSPLPSILRTIVYEDEDRVYGHQSLLRVYEHTWIVQHLSADPTGRRSLFAARDANVGVTDLMNQSPDVLWIRTYFQPQKAFPDRVVGGFARKMAGHPQSGLRKLSYLVSPSAGAFDEGHGDASDIEVRPWRPDDYHHIEACFLEQGRLLELQANDLSQHKLELTQIGAVYRAVGLERWREVWMAERCGRVLGFVLLELSSIGLNLSDITNHAAIYSWEDPEAVGHVLARLARRRCEETGRGSCIILSEPSQATIFEAIGFTKKRDYACWTLHRSLLPGYRDYTMQILGGDFRARGR